MTEPASPYNLHDLLLIIGECTVELAYLRRRVAELEARLAAEASDNGTVGVYAHAE
jgi:hypothetical protein